MREERKSVPTKLQDLAEKEGFLFKEISAYPNYYITNDGRVWSSNKNDFLAPVYQPLGYVRVSLCNNGNIKNHSVHRLVAEAFLENPLNLPMVNHKDENPSNNAMSNLEWCTSKYNNNYGTRIERQTKSQTNRKDCSKAVIQMDKAGNILEVFPSSKEAWRKTGISHIHIREVCKGKPKHKSAGGYVWRWATDYKEEIV